MRVKWQYVLIKKFLIGRKNPFIKLQLRIIQRTHGMMRHLIDIYCQLPLINIIGDQIHQTMSFWNKYCLASTIPCKKGWKFLNFKTTPLLMLLQNTSDRRSGFIDKKQIITIHWNFWILVLPTAQILLIWDPIQVADDYEIITRKQVRADS